MIKIKIIKKIKANYIRFQLHRLFGFMANLLIYFGYLNKLSKWAHDNRKSLKYNDFYNSRVSHKERTKLYQYLLETEELQDAEITYVEFGVGRGNSIRWWSEQNKTSNSTFFGFDTFEGLPEKWGAYEEGTFSQEGNFPDIKDKRVTFVKGLFQDTLADTLPSIDFSKRNIIHLDADLYSATLFPMAMVMQKLKPNDLVIFDEFGVPLHEFRAFEDFTKSYYYELEPIGAINNYLEVAFRVK